MSVFGEPGYIWSVGEISKSETETMADIIRRARGRYKRPPGGKSFAEEMAEYKREEIALEEAKMERMIQAGVLPVKCHPSWQGGETKTTG